MVEAYVPALADTENADAVDEGAKKKAYHHGDLRNAIILKATARARESGEKAIVLREIAPQIGVSATAAYRHFTNRQQLVEEVSARGYIALGERIAALESAAATSDPMLAAYIDLRNTAIAAVEFAADEPAWARMMLENLGSSATVAEQCMAVREIMQKIIDRGVGAGTFTPGLRLDGQRALWAAILGLSAQAMFGVQPADPAESAESTARTIDLCMTDMLTPEGQRIRDAAELSSGIRAGAGL